MGFLKKIIKNDAMKNDPPEIYNWRIYLLALSSCFGGVLYGHDIGAIGGILVLPQFETDYGLDKMTPVGKADISANIVSILQAGSFVGALASYWVADRYGRKPALLVAGVFAIAGITMQAASSTIIGVLYAGRFVAGLGVGAASVLTPLYISENSPRAIRGLLTGGYQLSISFGVMLSYWVNLGCSQHLKGKTTYVVALAMQMAPAFFLLGGMMLCYESPRYLAKVDDWEKASATLSKIYNLPIDHPYLQKELSEMAAQLENERRLVGGSSFMDLQREMWTIPGNRKRILIAEGIMVLQQLTGNNAINYYAPQIFNSLGLTGGESSLFATGIYGVVKVVTCTAFILFAADSLGRRRSLLWTAIAQGIVMYIIGTFVRTNPPTPDSKLTAFAYVAIVCIFLFTAIFQFGWGPCPWIYISEIPTARLRSISVAMGSATQWLFNFVVARATPNMLATMGKGGYGTYFLYGSFSFSMFFYVWFLVPETKGLSLEAMDEIFGTTEREKDIESSGASGSVEIAAAASEEKAKTILVEKVAKA